MSNLHQQLKQRRKALGLRQQDMEMRIGMPRQQYQRLESGGNPRLETLELVAKGLNLRVMLIPEDKVRIIEEFLTGQTDLTATAEPISDHVADNPWQGLLGDEDD
ncbi:transcriptional regulator with XRE-family HTH domain [Marinobacter sp. MBR-99]|jgi:transcriptional regulator with XRE-family HTH domain|uniref:helix-turn-helix domain-containing protein n=1 Tax=Marinobacter sp. MBR-99 TaxID=3156461 RepID=UPI003391C2C4